VSIADLANQYISQEACMLYIDLPTLPEFKALISKREDACVSIYVATTPLTQHVGATVVELGNLAKQALAQLEAVDHDKRSVAAIAEYLDDLAADDDFWRFQANALAVFATSHSLQTFRLPNRLHSMVQVSDRFHLKPLLRAITFPHRAFVIALTENDVRLVEVFPDMPAMEVSIKQMPKDAGSATGRASVNDRSPAGRIHGSEGQKVLLRQYVRKVDAAIRSVLAGRSEPLIIAATEPLLSIWRSVNSYPGLADRAIIASPGNMTSADLADQARPILDEIYAGRIDSFRRSFEAAIKQGRATTDVVTAARAATYGAIDTVLVDIDEIIPGTVDEETGAVKFAAGESAATYGIVDEIAGRALLSGATVLGVRKEDIPDGAPLAATLRYSV